MWRVCSRTETETVRWLESSRRDPSAESEWSAQISNARLSFGRLSFAWQSNSLFCSLFSLPLIPEMIDKVASEGFARREPPRPPWLPASSRQPVEFSQCVSRWVPTGCHSLRNRSLIFVNSSLDQIKAFRGLAFQRSDFPFFRFQTFHLSSFPGNRSHRLRLNWALWNSKSKALRIEAFKLNTLNRNKSKSLNRSVRCFTWSSNRLPTARCAVAKSKSCANSSSFLQLFIAFISYSRLIVTN